MKFNLSPAFLTCLLIAHAAFAQAPCVELKNYEFFIGTTKDRWSESALEDLIEARLSGETAGWVVPVIVEQLSKYEPACGGKEIDRRFELLLKLYAGVHKLPRLEDASVSPEDKIKLIRDDFQARLNDDREFDRLIYTMDDGPFTGKPAPTVRSKPLSSRDHEVVFGKLRVSNLRKGGVIVTALSKRGRQLFSRRLFGVNSARPLKAAQLETLAVEQTDFVVLVSFFADGERLTFYTRPNGRFMYYRHSW